MKINTPTEQEWERARFPKFLICYGDDRDFVFHTEFPRFLIEYRGNAGTATFIDDQKEFIDYELANGREPSATLARLMREAGDFFINA